ncbi:DNA helicase HerA-like ATPase [Streptomyces sp. 3211.6]|uniref:ATP-binding protein n=1 Tax=Streptomyces sp. 3211.6 TaxID=1938845 RepID=UPI000F11755D|nr:ATP-binding protein [Streptomyces sp. 3211.6]RKT02202.1 DNA helicase HerA-like ATPase [Streptomyces sp. 3211.6]
MIPGAAAALAGHRFHRLLTIPRRPEEPHAQDRTPAQLTAAVTAAHAVLSHRGGPDPAGLAMAWIRPGRHEPLHFLAGGAPFFPPAGEEPGGGRERPLRYPPGATAREVPPEEVAGLLGRMPYWVPCTGVHEPLRLGEDGRSLPTERRGSFDDAAAHLPDPFAWLVLAEPVPHERLERERTALGVALPRLRQRENSEADRIAAERAEARYRELTRALATGIWSVRVLVGADHPETALASAALLCGSGELDDLPYLLVPARHPVPLAEAMAADSGTAGAQGGGPFTAPAELVAALARPPARELPGIQTVTANRFDVSSDVPEAAADGFLLGDVLDESLTASGPLHVSRATLNRHTFVCGATGSGKSQTVRSLLTALSTHERPVPWLAVEPAKAEYARMAGRLAARRAAVQGVTAGQEGTPAREGAAGPSPLSRVTVIRPGDVDVAPASLNPLEPEPGFPLQSHVDLVRALFLAAFEGHEPFPQVLARALTQCYTAAGWDLVTGEPRPAYKPRFRLDEPEVPRTAHYPTLTDLQTTAQRVVEMIGYGREVTADVRGFVDVRIGSLREGTPGRFFQGGHPLDVAGLLAGNVVLELETITNDQDKAFLIGAVLIRIVEHLRVHHGTGGVALRHVLVVEEAHRLLKNVESGPAAAAVELFASLLAEIRAYGEGVVIVEQIPSKILADVIKNSALKVMHRLPAEDDRRSVGATMNLQSEQSESVVALRPGRAAVAADGMDRPVLTAVPHGEGDESAEEASTAPPLLGSRSALCGASCRRSPCTLRTMNDAHHRSLAPLHLIWVEAAAAAQAMGMPAPGPAPAVREALKALPDRDLDCTLVYAVERAVAAREPLMREEVDPGDFAARLHAVLASRLLGTAPPDEDRRRYTYANYRFRDVLEVIHKARRDRPDGPHDYPGCAAEWAARGLVLTGTSGADHRRQVRALACYGPDRAHGRVGDVVRSGLSQALTAVTGGTTQEHVGRGFRLACVPGTLVETLVEETAERIATECARGKEPRS